MMELVELTPLRRLLVGSPAETGLSVEQRKRLSIAVELISNPAIVLMDEPTSGQCCSEGCARHRMGTWQTYQPARVLATLRGLDLEQPAVYISLKNMLQRRERRSRCTWGIGEVSICPRPTTDRLYG